MLKINQNAQLTQQNPLREVPATNTPPYQQSDTLCRPNAVVEIETGTRRLDNCGCLGPGQAQAPEPVAGTHATVRADAGDRDLSQVQWVTSKRIGRLLVDAVQFLSSKDIIHGQIVEVVDGPVSTLLDMCQTIHRRILDVSPPEDKQSNAARLLHLTDERLAAHGQALAEAFANPRCKPAQLTACRDEVVKTLLLLYRMGEKTCDKTFSDVFDFSELHRWIPLALNEIRSITQILRGAGRLLAEGEMVLARCAELASLKRDSAQGRRAERNLRVAEDAFVQLPEMVNVRRDLRLSDEIEREGRKGVWNDLVEKCKPGAVRRRLEGIEAEIMRRLDLAAHLTAPLGSGEDATKSGDEESIFREILNDVVFLLNRGKTSVSAAQELQSAARDGTARVAGLQGVQGRGNGPQGKTRHKAIAFNVRLTHSESSSQKTRERLIAQAMLGQTAELALDAASRILRNLCFLISTPRQVLDALTELTGSIHRLAGDKDGSSGRDQSLLQRAAGVMAVAEQLQFDEDGSALLADRIRLCEERKLLYLWVSTEYSETRVPLRAAFERAQTRQKRRARKATVSAVAQDDSDRDMTPRKAVTPSAAAICAEKSATTWAALAADRTAGLHEVGEAGLGWIASKQSPRFHLLSSEGARWVADVFDRGTFSSPLRSLVYHFRKHTSTSSGDATALNESNLVAYVEAAREARAGWAEAVKAGSGYRLPCLADPASAMRIINTLDVYLVMTDKDDAKVVSFRDRRRYGRE